MLHRSPSTVRYLVLILLAVLPNVIPVWAFSSYDVSLQRDTTKLSAWSLPSPSDLGGFSIKTTWYDEYNPTARKTVYNDRVFVPTEMTYSALAMDWPLIESMEMPSREIAQPGARRNRNPFRRVAVLANRFRRRG